MSSLIEKAKAFATKAHEGQTRWGGEPYITHPEAVAKLVEEAGGDEKAIATAWLHDVLEDCDVDPHTIRNEFTFLIWLFVNELTRQDDESYTEYIANLAEFGTKTAILVKIQDLKHNLSTLHVGKDGKKNQQRRNAYELAKYILEKELERLNELDIKNKN